MTESNMPNEGGPERVSLNFEEWAAKVGWEGLNAAVTGINDPEKALTVGEYGQMWLALAQPYASLLRDGPYNPVTARAAHNALSFATAVASHLIGRRTLPLYPSYFDKTTDRATIKQKILEDQAAYLKDRPTLQAWIDRYKHELDPSETYYDVVTAVVAVTLKQLEGSDPQE